MHFTLRDYQQTDVDRLRGAFKRGRRSVLYCLPTGGGKTVVFSAITELAQAKSPTESAEVFILVHRQELLRQASKALDDAGIRHGWIASGHIETSDPIQIASVQTLARRLVAGKWNPKLIIVDEGHHATAGQWAKVLAFFPNARILGVTATPRRLDGKGLGEVYEELIEGPTISELIERGYLAPPVVYAPPMQFDTRELKKTGGDFTRKSANEAVDKPKITGDAVAHYRKFLDGKPAIAFCCTRKHAEHVAESFREAGYLSESVDGTLDAEVRKQRIADLGNGKLHVLTSCEIISEGTDIPVVAGALLLRPTASVSLFLQQVGRALRLFPGKTRAIILDHVGNWERHGLPTADREWSLDGAVRRGKGKPKEVVPCVQCKKCFCTHEPAPECPECGFVYPIHDRTPMQVAGELQEIDEAAVAKKHARQEVGKAQTLEELRAIGTARGYKPGWADHVFKSRNGRRRA
jgi:DNA repair protein RadD